MHIAAWYAIANLDFTEAIARYRELLAKGQSVDYQSVLAESERRDMQDSTRTDSPLTYDQTYTVIDTSDLTIDQVAEAIVQRVRSFC